MKVLLLANTDWYLFNFRLSLIKKIIDIGHEVVLVSPSGKYCNKFKELKIKHVPISMARDGSNLLREVKTLMALWKIYRDQKPDLVHHFTLKSVFYGLIVARILNIKTTVNALTGMGYVFTSQRKKTKLLKLLIEVVLRALLTRNGDKVVVQNIDDYKYIFNRKIINKENLCLIEGSGVNADSFVIKKYQKVAQPKILFASRLIKDKGIYELLESAKIVLKERPNVKYIIGGDVDIEHPTSVKEKDILYWQTYENVEFVGHIADIRSFLKDVDVVVLPSYREGLPRILIEAAASGLAIIATDVIGCNSVVYDYENGILVPPRDANALAEAIIKLTDSVVMREEFGQHGRFLAKNRFDSIIINDQTVSLYSQ